jgi:CDP-paratose 2-epimerase
MTKQFLITGGAGFIGSNYVARLIERGEPVTVYDNLSRAGAQRNIDWLHKTYGKNAFQLIQNDIRSVDDMRQAAKGADVIVHLAAQVAVTTSVTEPREDFEINALGTFNMLEAARASGRNPVILYASTNKVYGGMEEVGVVEEETHYRYADLQMGVPESQPLDFHSPYGCSKGAGDQYVRDYHRIYGLPTIVLRQSCIYGPRQFGIEDQGWLAWFVIAAVTGKPISIYGDGKQVRDVLYVSDLLDAYDACLEKIDQAAGKIYNIGGGPQNTISVWQEFGPMLEASLGRALPILKDDWRPGDQRIFVSDIRKAEQQLGWKPRVSVQEGLDCLFEWVKANRDLF